MLRKLGTRQTSAVFSLIRCFGGRWGVRESGTRMKGMSGRVRKSGPACGCGDGMSSLTNWREGEVRRSFSKGWRKSSAHDAGLDHSTSRGSQGSSETRRRTAGCDPIRKGARIMDSHHAEVAALIGQKAHSPLWLRHSLRPARRASAPVGSGS